MSYATIRHIILDNPAIRLDMNTIAQKRRRFGSPAARQTIAKQSAERGALACNSKLRSECLNAHWFMSLADAQEKLGTWCRHSNEDRPHSAIGSNVPIALHYPGGATSTSP